MQQMHLYSELKQKTHLSPTLIIILNLIYYPPLLRQYLPISIHSHPLLLPISNKATHHSTPSFLIATAHASNQYQKPRLEQKFIIFAKVFNQNQTTPMSLEFQTNPTSNLINTKHFLSVLIDCCFRACSVINLSSSHKTQFRYKVGDDPVTQIDHTIQKLIVDQLQENSFSGVNIVGEEQIDQDMVHKQILQSVQSQVEMSSDFQAVIEAIQEKHLKKEEISIFIDPLDCTRGYISGKLWQCTVLIGVTLNQVPILGIIGQPFKKISQSLGRYQPQVLVGGTLFKERVYYEYNHGYWLSNIKIRKEIRQRPKIAISVRRSSQKQDCLISHLDAVKHCCGGSGNKLSMLIRGQVDGVIFVGCPLSSWDSCAGQAILLGLDGYMTKPNDMKIEYCHKREDQTNRQGIICCFDKKLHRKIVQFMKF